MSESVWLLFLVMCSLIWLLCMCMVFLNRMVLMWLFLMYSMCSMVLLGVVVCGVLVIGVGVLVFCSWMCMVVLWFLMFFMLSCLLMVWVRLCEMMRFKFVFLMGEVLWLSCLKGWNRCFICLVFMLVLLFFMFSVRCLCVGVFSC